MQDEVQSVSRQTEWGASKIEANYLRPRIAPATVELGKEGAPNEPFAQVNELDTTRTPRIIIHGDLASPTSVPITVMLPPCSSGTS